jgi:hypothetical protein
VKSSSFAAAQPLDGKPFNRQSHLGPFETGKILILNAVGSALLAEEDVAVLCDCPSQLLGSYSA